MASIITLGLLDLEDFVRLGFDAGEQIQFGGLAFGGWMMLLHQMAQSDEEAAKVEQSILDKIEVNWDDYWKGVQEQKRQIEEVQLAYLYTEI